MRAKLLLLFPEGLASAKVVTFRGFLPVKDNDTFFVGLRSSINFKLLDSVSIRQIKAGLAPYLEK